MILEAGQLVRQRHDVRLDGIQNLWSWRNVALKHIVSGATWASQAWEIVHVYI